MCDMALCRVGLLITFRIIVSFHGHTCFSVDLKSVLSSNIQGNTRHEVNQLLFLYPSAARNNICDDLYDAHNNCIN